MLLLSLSLCQVRLVGTATDETTLYMMMDAVMGGELFSYLQVMSTCPREGEAGRAGGAWSRLRLTHTQITHAHAHMQNTRPRPLPFPHPPSCPRFPHNGSRAHALSDAQPAPGRVPRAFLRRQRGAGL